MSEWPEAEIQLPRPKTADQGTWRLGRGPLTHIRSIFFLFNSLTSVRVFIKGRFLTILDVAFEHPVPSDGHIMSP